MRNDLRTGFRHFGVCGDKQHPRPLASLLEYRKLLGKQVLDFRFLESQPQQLLECIVYDRGPLFHPFLRIRCDPFEDAKAASLNSFEQPLLGQILIGFANGVKRDRELGGQDACRRHTRVNRKRTRCEGVA